MQFGKICIVGTGLIGGSLALAFRKANVGEKFFGIDLAEMLETINAQQIVDIAYEPSALEIAVEDADLIILAMNIKHIIEYIPKVALLAKSGAIVTDVGSTKEEIVRQAQKYFEPDVYFIGGHPMAGSEKNSVTAADPYLFENCFYLLTPFENTPKDILKKLSFALEMIGSKILILDAGTHDRIAAAVSHLPQMLAICLVNFIKDFHQFQPNSLKLAAGGFRDMTRIASSPFDMWKDICETNSANIIKMLENFINNLNQFKVQFKQTNLKSQFDSAAKTRLSIPKDTKGFINPNYDVSVQVEDKPGVIARIATSLAESGINIRDIEVLKVRLLEGGTLRLSFGTENDRLEAISVLQKQGFLCRIK